MTLERQGIHSENKLYYSFDLIDLLYYSVDPDLKEKWQILLFSTPTNIDMLRRTNSLNTLAFFSLRRTYFIRKNFKMLLSTSPPEESIVFCKFCNEMIKPYVVKLLQYAAANIFKDSVVKENSRKC